MEGLLSRWPRLLLPTILLVEGVGVWGAVPPRWQGARMAAALTLELAAVVLAVRALRGPRRDDEWPEARLARALSQLVPATLARLVAFELVLVGGGLALLIGRARAPVGFTYHREANLRLLLWMMPLLLVADVALLELVLLPRAPPWLRVVAHLVGVYGLLWLIGLYASMRARPHQLVGDRLVLHRGLLGRVELTRDQIVSVGPLPSFASEWALRAYRQRAVRADVSGPSVLVLGLRAAVRPMGARGPGRAGDLVLVSVDDPASFLAALGPITDPRADSGSPDIRRPPA